jgi:hypothetical protein
MISNLFRLCPAGSREGRIVLVQFNSMGAPENLRRPVTFDKIPLPTQAKIPWDDGVLV